MSRLKASAPLDVARLRPYRAEGLVKSFPREYNEAQDA